MEQTEPPSPPSPPPFTYPDDGVTETVPLLRGLCHQRWKKNKSGSNRNNRRAMTHLMFLMVVLGCMVLYVGEFMITKNQNTDNNIISSSSRSVSNSNSNSNTILISTITSTANVALLRGGSNEKEEEEDKHDDTNGHKKKNHHQINVYDYDYSITNDCYSEGVDCPHGTWCQVAVRENWYPYAVSYINRGRCLPYAALQGACDPAFEGRTAFPRKADGSYFDRATLCDPSTTTCTGNTIFVLPPTCVKARDPSQGCMSTERNGCAGRTSPEECPDDSFCIFPPPREPLSESASESEDDLGTTLPPIEFGGGGVTQTKLEQCAAIVTSFNGPSFALTTDKGENPDDSHIEVGTPTLLEKHAMEHGTRNAPLAQQILKTLWPYSVCGENEEEQDSSSNSKTKKRCTSFPLPVPARNNDGGLIAGKCLQGKDQIPVNCASLTNNNNNNNPVVDMNFLRTTSDNGATDYHCTWMILHTFSFQGGAVLTRAEKQAFGELFMYISGQFDCKICRNNFVDIIHWFGVPTSSIREEYARWLWQAHNNANEHSYATHSYGVEVAQKVLQQSGGRADTKDPYDYTRTNEWAHPTYEHPWYMTYEDAVRVWTHME